ncbi:uncharacterized protein LY89DRAFT_690269 [Mollisia scopiformis]|uniref:Uncharacterized protein n=1 Tax=Mollisia scopiformis TaxID=149040 RepID=A0A132B9X7_MOLSC|nr:uncharacterized protein LY89DRAFT_690269 [Mollisia scopiformis]KUJ09210.1 hypothetical protein LY89DRAFT_690269 [Mollisia scopiformis]
MQTFLFLSTHFIPLSTRGLKITGYSLQQRLRKAPDNRNSESQTLTPQHTSASSLTESPNPPEHSHDSHPPRTENTHLPTNELLPPIGHHIVHRKSKPSVTHSTVQTPSSSLPYRRCYSILVCFRKQVQTRHHRYLASTNLVPHQRSVTQHNLLHEIHINLSKTDAPHGSKIQFRGHR